jgi:cytochrome c553
MSKWTMAWAGLLGAAAITAGGAQAPLEGDVAKGQAAAAVCAACHGMDGNSVVPLNPNLAGQHAGYVAKQLGNFHSGERKNEIMKGMVAALSAADMANLAAFYAAQAPRLGLARDQALVDEGRTLYRGGNLAAGIPACSACHGPEGAGIPAQFPRLAGQFKEYTLAQLKAFRAGERANDAAAVMRSIAGRLNDRQMEALAEYVSGLR